MKKVLIWTPILLFLVLVQSYFWVPTYDEQTRGNPDRMKQFITASIGDAQVLNPILSADASSSEIEAKIFEGLLDRDEDLNFRGRLAIGWEIYEEAYFYINDRAELPGGKTNTPETVIALLHEAMKSRIKQADGLSASLENIRDINLIPRRTYEVAYPLTTEGGKTPPVSLEISAPPRIQVVLKTVDQNFFKNIASILGENYFSGFTAFRFIKGIPQAMAEKAETIAQDLLPVFEHNPVIVFHLRPGVKFHDGSTFNAEDVKFTYDAIMDPKNISPRTSDYEPIKSVEVLDPLTVRIVYKRLFSPALGTWGMGILPSHLLNRDVLQKEAVERGLDPKTFSMRQSRFNRHPVGCGPFRFREWKSDQYIILDRFDDYWEGPPTYEKFVYRIIPDRLTQEMEFYAGTVDDYAVQPHQVERLEKNPAFQSFSGLSFAYSYIGYNMRREIFKDRRVRTALGMAIDVEKIIKYVLYDQGERITGPFLKQTEYYDPKVKPLSYDPEKALALLHEAGYRTGRDGWLEKNGTPLRFTLITNQGNDLRQAILSIAQDSWRKLGVDARTDVLEWAVFIQERVNKLDFDALVLGWSMGIDPDLYQIWHSSQTGPNQLNFVNFRDETADRLIVEIRQEYDHGRQVELCHRLHEIIVQEQPYTFLYAGKWTAVLDKRIKIKTQDARGNVTYEPIRPTKTGNYTFHFNRWVKLSKVPRVSAED